ncbi:MAG: hypothetical protein R3B96_05590 [Pirellulaceae bacterium]
MSKSKQRPSPSEPTSVEPPASREPAWRARTPADPPQPRLIPLVVALSLFGLWLLFLTWQWLG